MDKIKTLYVDDEDVNLLLFSINFKNEFDVKTALNGKEALAILKSNPDIRVLISDMSMPGMNGVELIREAKSLNPDLLCFILTAYSINSEIEDAVKNKLINKWFSKPLEKEIILKEVKAVLEA